MRTVLSITFLLVNFLCLSQSENHKIKYSREVIGRSPINNNEIIVEHFTFTERIEELTLSGKSKEIVVYLRGVSPNGKWLDNTGDYIQYDLNEKAIRWSREFSYAKMNWYTQSENMIVFTSGFRSWLLDYETGVKKWKSKNNIYYIQPKINIGIAHGFSGIYGKPLIRGINLKNGTELWNEKLANYHGWDDLFLLDDSTLLLVSSGITLLSLKTGKIWQNTDIIKCKEPDSYTKHSFNRYTNSLTGNLSKHQKEHNAKANENIFLVNSSSIFIINGNVVANISKENGYLNWKTSISSNYDKLSIREDESNFYILQKSMEVISEPTCRILSVSKSNGAITFEKQFNRQIDDYGLLSDILYFISNNEVYKYNLLTQLEERMNNYPIDSIGSFTFIVQGNIFCLNQSGFVQPFVNRNENEIILFTDKQKVVELNEDLSIKTITDENYLYHLKKDSENHKLVSQKNNLFLINEKGKILAKLGIAKNAIIEEDIVYYWDNNVLNIIDLEKIDIK